MSNRTYPSMYAELGIAGFYEDVPAWDSYPMSEETAKFARLYPVGIYSAQLLDNADASNSQISSEEIVALRRCVAQMAEVDTYKAYPAQFAASGVDHLHGQKYELTSQPLSQLEVVES